MNSLQQHQAGKDHRLDIQGLRAIAVLVVLVFHIWPEWLPGGYVGVDVFFVISGYLITGLLAREVERTERVDLWAFYGRRVRRLMPAAALVVTFVAVSALAMPVVQWPSLAKDVLASTLYVQNWWLVEQSVDYLSQDHTASALQHYWSLSVEEQYYLFWPVILLIGLRLKRGLINPAGLFGPLVVTIALLSFIYGLVVINSQPEIAYFSTLSRVWELALGGALALYGAKLVGPASLKWLAGVLGIIGIIVAAVFYTDAMAFPGALALLPTLGAALVLWAGEGRSFERKEPFIARLLSLKPLVLLGGVSYALYLWHWPLIVVFKTVLGTSPDIFEGVVIIVVAIILSVLTKQFVEDRFRFTSKPGFAAVGVLSSCVALAMICSAGLSFFYHQKVANALEGAKSPSVLKSLAAKPYNPDKPTVPDGLAARKDNPDLYRYKCHVGMDSAKPKACEFGDKSAPKLLILVGDSHAGQWLPALQMLAKLDAGWRIVSHTKSDCPFVNVLLSNPRKGGAYTPCMEWNQTVAGIILAAKPDLIVTSASNQYRVFADDNDNLSKIERAYQSTWTPLLNAGIPILVVSDTPRMTKDIPECMTSPFGSVEACSVSRETVDFNDPISNAATQTKGVRLIDFTDAICDQGRCAPVKGQLLIWRDSHHLTATFTRFLAPKFLDVLPELAEE
ncbi:acyltransferase family protein [Simiduia litorea]|uniref:acyltransferase family protein n=1 Tax=Simiduia litorea TaxID=1435348 RepID=UPI0036F1F6CD